MRKRPPAASAVSKFCIVGSFSPCVMYGFFRKNGRDLADLCGETVVDQRSSDQVKHDCYLSRLPSIRIAPIFRYYPSALEIDRRPRCWTVYPWTSCAASLLPSMRAASRLLPAD